MGYADRGQVTVLPYGTVQPSLGFEFYGYEMSVPNSELTQLHIGHLTLAGGDPHVTLPQDAADHAFRYMVSCS